MSDKKEQCIKNYIKALELGESIEIQNIASDWFQVGKINTVDNPFFSPAEIWLDIQNIPEWWRIVFNWGADICRSLRWASSWIKLHEENRQAFLATNPNTDFIEFVGSDLCDFELWLNAKDYLDNAIFRIYAYRDKIAWLLNSHGKLQLITKKRDVSFKTFRNKVEALNDFKEIAKILSTDFCSDQFDEMVESYRHDLTHNKTPSVDFPGIPQAEIKTSINENGERVQSIPLYVLQPPIFQLEKLLEVSLSTWGAVPEGN